MSLARANFSLGLAANGLWRYAQQQLGYLLARPGWAYSLTHIALIIIFYESLWQLNWWYAPVAEASLGVVLLITIALSAFRYGMAPALLLAFIANLYLFFAFAGPRRNLETVSNLMDSEWLIILLYFGPAIVVGYLRDRVVELLNRERLAREMAEQEQSRLTTILQQLPVGVVIAEASSGRVIFGNQYLEQLLGHKITARRDSAASLQPARRNGPSVTQDQGLSEHSLPLQEWPLKQVLSGQVLQGEEYSYSHQGHDHVLRVSGTPIYGPTKKITAGVVIINDITEEKALQQRKDDFVSMVSHELKTPLTSLKMYVQLAARQIGDVSTSQPGTQKALDRANAQADKLTQLVTDMLTLSRTQSGKLEYRFEPVDVYALLATIAVELQTANPSHQLRLEGRSVGPIEADPDRLGQVFINIIANAIKYSPQVDKVLIGIKRGPKDVVISVQDFGIGIKNSEQKRIFERFYQISDNAGRTYPGLGVGLYLCAEIVKRHHGRIWVDSQLGQGATFYISLPLKQPSPAVGSEPPA